MDFIKEKHIEDKIRAIYKERYTENNETDLVEHAILSAELLFEAGLLMEAEKIYLRILSLNPEDETINQKLENLNLSLN